MALRDPLINLIGAPLINFKKHNMCISWKQISQFYKILQSESKYPSGELLSVFPIMHCCPITSDYCFGCCNRAFRLGYVFSKSCSCVMRTLVTIRFLLVVYLKGLQQFVMVIIRFRVQFVINLHEAARAISAF